MKDAMSSHLIGLSVPVPHLPVGRLYAIAANWAQAYEHFILGGR
jgi:hypothetical protein